MCLCISTAFRARSLARPMLLQRPTKNPAWLGRRTRCHDAPMIGTRHHIPSVSGNYGEGRGTGADACKSKEAAQEVSVPDDYEFDEDLVDEDVEELPRIPIYCSNAKPSNMSGSRLTTSWRVKSKPSNLSCCRRGIGRSVAVGQGRHPRHTEDGRILTLQRPAGSGVSTSMSVSSGLLPP